MKFTLDTANRTVTLASDEVIGKVVETLEKLFPNGEWREFKLITNNQQQIVWNPIYIEPYRPWQQYPWWQPLRWEVYNTTGPSGVTRHHEPIYELANNRTVYQLEVQDVPR